MKTVWFIKQDPCSPLQMETKNMANNKYFSPTKLPSTGTVRASVSCQDATALPCLLSSLLLPSRRTIFLIIPSSASETPDCHFGAIVGSSWPKNYETPDQLELFLQSRSCHQSLVSLHLMASHTYPIWASISMWNTMWPCTVCSTSSSS